MTELLLRITAKATGLAPMIQSLTKVMFQAKLERGCVDCRLYAETGDPRSFLYAEQSETSQALDVQFRSQRFRTLLAIMETAAGPPDLQLRTISEQCGLDYVRRICLNTPVIAHNH